MLTQRWRPVLLSFVAIAIVWGAALTGFSIAKNSRPTAERVRAYVESTDLARLSGAARAKVINTLADKLNELPQDERRRAQLEKVTQSWLEVMTEQEKMQFVEATLPSGFKQMLIAFEQLPPEKKRRTIEDTIRRLRESKAKIAASEGRPIGTNAPPPVNKEALAQIRAMGLEEFYGQSSAQMKAEMAPVFEELQRVMESGRPFHGR